MSIVMQMSVSTPLLQTEAFVWKLDLERNLLTCIIYFLQKLLVVCW